MSIEKVNMSLDYFTVSDVTSNRQKVDVTLEYVTKHMETRQRAWR